MVDGYYTVVSIPVGFFQALQRTSLDGGQLGGDLRFNPCRVFSGLATFRYRSSVGPMSQCFNPCRVFSGLATGVYEVRRLTERDVSIPVGFFQALQRRTQGSSQPSAAMFQSLSGFFRPCNSDDTNLRRTGALFQSLSGFFRPCNLGDCLHVSATFLLFQSLSGFFRPCNFSK